MKFKSLFIALMAFSAMFAACQEEKPVFGISADTDAIELPQGGGTAQVTVTTAQAWNVKIPLDAQAWLIADPSSGIGNATITITATANEGKDRKNIQGYDVLLDERMALHEAYLGDLSTIHANMPEAITVKADFDIVRNVNQYLGVALFDCAPAVPSAFVKLAKAS